MLFKYLRDKREGKRKRLEDKALVLRLAKKAREYMTSDPPLSLRFIQQMHRIYDQKFGGYDSDMDTQVSSLPLEYIRKHGLSSPL